MKPAFALNLAQDGIGLLHRSGEGWSVVGTVAFDDPALPQTLATLRQAMAELSPDAVGTKLIIPDSQILYTEIEAPGPSASQRKRQITRALEGRTPYDVKDLVFDWSGTGPLVKVAVVARETLTEAEAFAEEHKFDPLGFVAIPAPGVFEGEPFFGPSTAATRLLPPGAKFERDAEPVRLVVEEAEIAAPAEPEVAVPEVAEVAAPEAEPTEAAVVDDTIPGLAEALQDETPLPPPADIPAAEPAAAEAEPEALDLVADPLAETADWAPEPEAEEETPNLDAWIQDEPAQIAAEPLHEPAAEPDLPLFAAAPEPAPEPEPEFDPAAAEALVAALDTPPMAEPSVAEPPLTDPAPEPQAPAAEPVAPAPLFATVRGSAVDTGAAPRIVAPRLGPAGGAPALGAATGPVVPPLIVDPAAPASGEEDLPPAPTIRLARGKGGKAVVATKAGIARKDPPAPKPAVTKPAAAPMAGGLARHLMARASGKVAPAPASAPRVTQVDDTASPAAFVPPRPGAPSSTTVFGGRRPVKTRRSVGLGVWLTVALVLLLAAVAIWSTFLGSSSVDPLAGVAPADLAAENGTPAPDAGVDPEALADGEMLDGAAPADLAPPADLDVTEPQPLPADMIPAEPAAEPTPAPTAPAATTGAALPADEADTVWGALPQSGAEPGVTLPAPDAVTAGTAPAALPQADTLAAEPPPATPPQAPPFGTVIVRDANGWVQPTAEGVLTPEGTTLFAGAPPRKPAPRPAEVLTAAGAAAPAPEAATETATEPAPYADPALQGKRPQPRPAGLAPPAADQQGALEGGAPGPDATALAETDLPPADPALAGKRPSARPAAILAAAATAAPAEPPTDTAAIASDSTLAVATSRRPAARPSDFGTAIEDALAAAMTAPDPAPPAPAPEPAAAPEPQDTRTAAATEIDEPEPTTAAPEIPTSASVAAQATVANAINLGRTNLIGVYGASGNRRALVRLGNGRFVKVEVGDRLDGGKVASISEGQLTYVKNGKTVVLTLMKKG